MNESRQFPTWEAYCEAKSVILESGAYEYGRTHR